MAKRWNVSEGLYFEEYPHGGLPPFGVTLNYNPDGVALVIPEGELGYMIDALQRIKNYFNSIELAEVEAARLECWAKKRTPTEESETVPRMMSKENDD